MAAWAPNSNAELRVAIVECLSLSPADCSIGPHGSMWSWDISAVTDTSGLFIDSTGNVVPGGDKFNGDLSNWDVSRVTDMDAMLSGAKSFNGDLSKWDVSRVTNMDHMFFLATPFNGDISKWDVSSVTDMRHMFFGASSFAQTLCGVWKPLTSGQAGMFVGSSGRLCTSKTTSTTASS